MWFTVDYGNLDGTYASCASLRPNVYSVFSQTKLSSLLLLASIALSWNIPRDQQLTTIWIVPLSTVTAWRHTRPVPVDTVTLRFVAGQSIDVRRHIDVGAQLINELYRRHNGTVVQTAYCETQLKPIKSATVLWDWTSVGSKRTLYASCCNCLRCWHPTGMLQSVRYIARMAGRADCGRAGKVLATASVSAGADISILIESPPVTLFPTKQKHFRCH